MQDNSFFIILSVIGILMSVLFAYAYLKDKNRSPYFLLSALLFFLIPALLIAGTVLESEELIASAMVFPMGLFLIATAVALMMRYKRCNHPIEAECVACRRLYGNGWWVYYTPTFSFRYKGEDITVDSFVCYSKRKFDRLFDLRGTYLVFIDPENPRCCVDKRSFPAGPVVLLIVGIVFLVFGAAIKL